MPKILRPVSYNPFISKPNRKVITERLLDHMLENILMDRLQSAYMQGHNYETALLSVHNDIIVSAEDKWTSTCWYDSTGSISSC